MSGRPWRTMYRGDPELLTICGAARILGVSTKTVRRWAELGTLPCRREPGTAYRLFDRADVEVLRRQLSRG